MNVVEEGKTLESALEKALIKLNANQSEVIYKKEEQTSKLFKSPTVKVTVAMRKDVLEDIKHYLTKVIEGLNIKVEFETNIRDGIYNIQMYSDNNSILIGKNGQTLKALETLTKQKLLKDWNISFKISLNVEDYKEKRIEYLEKLAIKTAKEVKSTKIAVTLDNMNSYERRVIHNKLSDFKGISTTSEGEDPNRHIIIQAEK